MTMIFGFGCSTVLGRAGNLAIKETDAIQTIVILGDWETLETWPSFFAWTLLVFFAPFLFFTFALSYLFQQCFASVSRGLYKI